MWKRIYIYLCLSECIGEWVFQMFIWKFIFFSPFKNYAFFMFSWGFFRFSISLTTMAIFHYGVDWRWTGFWRKRNREKMSLFHTHSVTLLNTLFSRFLFVLHILLLCPHDHSNIVLRLQASRLFSFATFNFSNFCIHSHFSPRCVFVLQSVICFENMKVEKNCE